MSYDLAVWEDVPPFSGRSASQAFGLLCDRLDAGQTSDAPSPAITEFVEGLLARWPDLGDPGGDDSPWAAGPLLGEAFGPCIYFGVTFSGAEAAVPVIADMAREHGLICYDPQLEGVI